MGGNVRAMRTLVPLRERRDVKVARAETAMAAQHVIYISCVGEQDPISGKTQEEGPLLTCFRYLKDVKKIQCHAVYLIPTSRKTSPQRHTEDRAKESEQKIKSIDPQLDVRFIPLEVQNPANLREVYPKMRELLGIIVQQTGQETQGESLVFHLNVSSGTPQMKESLPFLVSIGHLAPHTTYLWQVFDPRGGLTELHQRVQPAPQMDLLTQERLLLRMEQLAKQFLYQETNGLLQTPLTTRYQKPIRRLYQILTNHDQWQYKQARNQLQELLEELKDTSLEQSLRDWLSEILNWLDELAQERPPKDKLAIDRYYCGLRRLFQGLYADAISHFWTACELALEAHGDDIQLPREQQESAWGFIRRLKRKSMLQQKEIHTKKSSGSILDATDWLRVIRNEIAHGLRPVGVQLAKDAKQITEDLLKALQWDRQLSSYPLRPEQVKDRLLALIQDMRESLWA